MNLISLLWTGARRKLAVLPCLLLPVIFSGCADSDQAARIKELESKVAALEAASTKPSPPLPAPRLGNIMSMVQLRHSKLWLAGEQGNWPLAGYELHELEEDFEDLEKLHPPPGSGGPPLGQIAAQLTMPAMKAMKQAIDSGDRIQFTASYDALTVSCNACHSAAGLSFNVIQRPTLSAWSNQDFTRRQPATPGPLRSAAAVGKPAAPK